MALWEISGGFTGWCVGALLLWLLAAAVGLVQRGSAGRLPAILVGAGSASLLAASVAGDGGFVLPSPWFLGDAALRFVADPLCHWFLAIIGLVGIAIAIFAPGYLIHLRHRVSPGFFWAALAALFASMALVLLSANAIMFLVAWEAMALASFVLVAADHEQRSVRHAALVYLGATRVGTAFLMGGFLWAHQLAGSWEFAAWHIDAGRALGPALLILVGLSVKAGCWPFHLWLPIAHPAAPAPVSAVMSGVMIKTAIYGMIRLLVLGPLAAPALGPILLVLGAVSAFWGVLFALLQNDLKRLLAYSSVENVGIIVMGLGVSMVAQRLGLSLLAQVGLAAALFHTLNHALFKSLLFLGAGSVDARTHTREIERLGGLIHRMPWTGACFLVGSAAICAFPPFNGFAGEWLLYQSFVGLAQSAPSAGLRLVGLLLIGWLALVGALALACFVKAAGIVFLGRPRTVQAEHAREGSRGMVAAQQILALACAILGLAAPAVLHALGSITGPAEGAGRLAGVWTLPLPLLMLVLAGSVVALAAWMTALSRVRPARRYITWECGFGDLGPRAQYTATSFAQPIARIFGALFGYSVNVRVEGRDRRHFPEAVSVEPVHESYLETRVYTPLLGLLQSLSATLGLRLQAGSIHQYLLYIMLALALLLWVGYRA